VKAIRTALAYRFSDESLDACLAQWAGYLGAIAVVSTSVVALVKHPGTRADFLFGLGLASVVSLLLAQLGTLCRQVMGLRDRLPLRSRWPEFASYAACLGLLVQGTRWLAGLELTPAQITLGLLLTCSLSVAVLVLGMMTTLIRSLRG
jgi:hypothetical protein